MAIAIQNQTLLDLAIQECGSVAAAFELAVANGMSLTDDLTPGQNISIPETVENGDTQVLSYVQKNNVRPASADFESSAAQTLQGIDYWIIGVDFKVS